MATALEKTLAVSIYRIVILVLTKLVNSKLHFMNIFLLYIVLPLIYPNFLASAPPPESIWASSVEEEEEFSSEVDNYFMDFEMEDVQESLAGNPMMPW